MTNMQNELVRVTKVFTMDMAHALFGYEGPCKNIHGHTYRMHVTLSGRVITDQNSALNGLVIDFGDIKTLVHEKIVSRFDHALVLHESAPYSIDRFLPEHFEKVILVPFQPSCECLMLHFREQIVDVLPSSVNLVYLRLEETATSYAEWRIEDQKS
jgi:6-pyruvoyltetrahydropterin/6-carboxytetrahydropterin synthase